jgi:hypothetical protein
MQSSAIRVLSAPVRTLLIHMLQHSEKCPGSVGVKGICLTTCPKYIPPPVPVEVDPFACDCGTLIEEHTTTCVSFKMQELAEMALDEVREYNERVMLKAFEFYNRALWEELGRPFWDPDLICGCFGGDNAEDVAFKEWLLLGKPLTPEEGKAAQRRRFEAALKAAPDRCMLAPKGWWCSRVADHQGPCAARLDVEYVTDLETGMSHPVPKKVDYIRPAPGPGESRETIRKKPVRPHYPLPMIYRDGVPLEVSFEERLAIHKKAWPNCSACLAGSFPKE